LPLRLNNSTRDPHRAVARMPSHFGSMQYAVVSEGKGAAVASIGVGGTGVLDRAGTTT
jgi:hypothetical protein